MRIAALLVVLITVVSSACALSTRGPAGDCELGTLVEVENRGEYLAQVFLFGYDADPTYLGLVEPGQTGTYSVGTGRAWVRLRTQDGRRASAVAQRLGGGVVLEYRCR